MNHHCQIWRAESNLFKPEVRVFKIDTVCDDCEAAGVETVLFVAKKKKRVNGATAGPFSVVQKKKSFYVHWSKESARKEEEEKNQKNRYTLI